MNHYFIYDPNREKNIIEIEGIVNGTKYQFSTDRGIFSYAHLDPGTITLIEEVKITNNISSVLDLGCGYGVIGIVLKKENENLKVTQTDINERAVELTIINNKKYKINNEVYLSDGFEKITEKFDLITLNPPIKAGKQIIFELYKNAYNFLNNEGEFYCVVKKNHGADSHYKYLKEVFGNASIVKKNKGFYVIKTKK